MKKEKTISIILTIQILLLGLNLSSQSIIDFGKFPVSMNSEEPLTTVTLLKELEWDRIKEYSKNNDGHYAYKRRDSLRTEYEYVQQGGVASFEIISFNGKVLEFHAEDTQSSKPFRIDYFDKKLWLEYVEYKMPNLEERFKISVEEPRNILKAYYILLGVDSRDEYGWICEYSTVGMPPKRRRAILELLQEHEMLINLLDYPNIQTQMYVIDALIYEHKRAEKLIIKEKDKEFKEFLQSQLLTKQNWKQIETLRAKKILVNTCGIVTNSNAGSYKIYKSYTNELLSKKAIKKIPKKYKVFQKAGYLN